MLGLYADGSNNRVILANGFFLGCMGNTKASVLAKWAQTRATRPVPVATPGNLGLKSGRKGYSHLQAARVSASRGKGPGNNREDRARALRQEVRAALVADNCRSAVAAAKLQFRPQRLPRPDASHRFYGAIHESQLSPTSKLKR